MIEPDQRIREWGRSGGVTPFADGQINAASYDVRASDPWIISMESEPEVACGEPGSSSHYQGQTGTTPARG